MEVKLLNLFRICEIDLGPTTFDLAKRDNKRCRNGAERQVYIETPSPGDMVSKNST